MNLKEDEARIGENIKIAVGKWFHEQCKNEYSDYYIYYRESKPGKPGEIFILKDNEDSSGLVLADNSRLRKDRTIEQTINYIRNTAKRFPICSLEY